MTTITCIKGKHTEGYRYNTQRNLTYVVPKKGKKGQTCPGFLFRWRIVSETRKHALDFCFVGGLFLKLGNMDLVCKSRTLFPTRTYILAKRLRAPTRQQIPERYSNDSITVLLYKSQLFSGYIITGMFSKIHFDITTNTTEEHYIIRIVYIVRVPGIFISSTIADILAVRIRVQYVTRSGYLLVFAASSPRILGRFGYTIASTIGLDYAGTSVVMPGPSGVCAANMVRYRK